MAQKTGGWLTQFNLFIEDLRISSKEVTTADQRGVKLELWDSQRRFLEMIGQGLDDDIHRFYCLKSRQLGVTTVSLAIDLFWLAVHPNMTCALVTENEKNREKNRGLLRSYVNSFPDGYFGDEFRIIKGGDNRQFMKFSNGSRIDFLVAGTKDKGTSWGEGEGYTFAHCTEVSAYGSAEGLASFMEAFAQENPARLFIFESTAKGMNHWYDKWKEAREDPYTSRTLFLGWWSSATNRIKKSDPRFLDYGVLPASGRERELVIAVHELYGHQITAEQLAWYRWREATASSEEALILDQNQPWTEQQAFVADGYSFFQTRGISKRIGHIADAPVAAAPEGFAYKGYRYELGNSFFDLRLEVVTDEQEQGVIELKVWEEPHKDGVYVLGCDTAWGRNDHKDRNAIEVFRCYADKIVQVAEFATAGVEVKHCAWVLAHLAGAYRDCMVNIELNGPGRNIMTEWDHILALMNVEMNQHTILEREWDDALGNARWYLYHRPDSYGSGYAANFETTARTGTEIMHQMRGGWVTNELEIRSIRLLEEMLNVVVDESGHIGATESSNENSKDDRVYATALANRAWINWRRQPLLAQGMTYKRVSEEESGAASIQAKSINGMVYRFFKRRDELENQAEPSQSWRADRGLE
jgi:hypothetical protein